MTSETVKEVLIDLGYSLIDNGREFRARPIYRESGNNMSLCIYKHDGKWTDFGVSKSGRLEDLIKITLNLKDISQAREYLENSFSVSALSKRDTSQLSLRILDTSLSTFVQTNTISTQNGEMILGGLITQRKKHLLNFMHKIA